MQSKLAPPPEDTAFQKINATFVAERLLEAVRTALCFQNWACVPQELRLRWQPVMLGLRMLAERQHAIDRWPVPDAASVARMIEALAWLSWLDEKSSTIVVSLSAVPPGSSKPVIAPATLATGCRMSVAQVEERYQRVVEGIARRVAEAEEDQRPAA